MLSYSDDLTIVALKWRGWADFDDQPLQSDHVAMVAGREYTVRLYTPARTDPAGRFADETYMSDLLWPTDHSWLYVTDTDLPFTIIAATADFDLPSAARIWCEVSHADELAHVSRRLMARQ